MWHKPQLLNTLADLLFLVGAAALLAAAAVWLVRVPAMPVQQVVFETPLQHTRRGEIERVLPGSLRGNFFTLDVSSVRQALLQLPWVRAVQVRRVWPAGLAIQVEEHQPLARWGEGYAEMINGHGEVFAALLAEDEMRRLPLLQGPQGTARQVMERFVALRELFATVGERPVQLSLSSRLAWRLTLDNGMHIEIGREHPKWPLEERLQRFVEVYAKEMAALENRPAVVDLRYPNGFAIKVAAVDAAKLKGK